MQSTLTELAADSVRRRNAGDPAIEIASRWSEAVNSLLDVSLAATGSVGRGEATPLCQIDVLRTEPGSTQNWTDCGSLEKSTTTVSPGSREVSLRTQQPGGEQLPNGLIGPVTISL